MKVKVTRLGFFNGSLVYPDDVLDVPEKLVSKTWMEPLEKPAEKPARKPAEKPAEPDGAI